MNNILHFGSSLKKILGIVLLMALLLISSHGLAHEPPQGDQKSVSEKGLPPAAPDLADIVPLAAELTGRLAVLENRIRGVLDFSAVGKKIDGIAANLKDPASQLQRLKDSKDYQYNKLLELRETIKQENELFQEISRPLSQAIRQLGAWRREWLAEKKRWNAWQSSLLKEGELGPIKSTFEKANDTIDTALNLILPQLEAMLTVQEKAGHIHGKINALAAELDGLMVAGRRGGRLEASPPMFSSQYSSQFSTELWYAVKKGLDESSWPGKRFFAQQGWIVLLQGFLSLILIIAVYRKRGVLNESKRWRFLAARPVSAGLFLGIMGTLLFYEYEKAPATWEVAYTIVAGISFARLSAFLVEASWKRQFVYGLMIVLIVTVLLDALSFPLPLFRLYTVFTALVGLLFCLRWAGESRLQKDSGLYTWALRLASLFFAVVMIAELWGKDALGLFVFDSLIDSIATVLVFMLFTYMIHGGLEWVFRTSSLRRAAVLHSEDTDAMARRVARFIDVAIWGLVVLPAILMSWGVYDSLEGATKGLLALGFNLGSQRITVGLLIISAGILYGSFLASWILQRLLVDEAFVGRRVERGVRLSIGRLVHYVLIIVGLLLALVTLGFELTKLTIMLSALGVGIGFGLQGVVNNFVSGLILLFERPVRVGDYIEFDGNWAEIKRIGLRATSVQTFDQADVIVPNAHLVTNPLTNWTLTNRRVRLIVPVGVAYGSDVPLVMETLAACPKDHEMVAAFPPPQVLFLGFGESSLDFELRIWVKDADHRLKVTSDLHQEIDRRFREEKIEIAFPQRDLHLRSVDESVNLRPSESS
jgi:small-conductance mechanosensitive channel